MKRLSPTWSLAGLILIVLVPLGVLSLLAWRGARAQERAVWEDLGREAELYGRALADRMALRLPEMVSFRADYPDPPVPGSASTMDIVLEGSDIAALKSLRDSPDAGLSAAGLPRQALAALRIMELAPGEQPARELEGLLMEKHPSILTEVALAKIDPQGTGARETWEQGRKALAMLRDRGARSGWVLEGATPWWFQLEQSGVKLIPPRAVDRLLKEESANFQHRDFQPGLSLEGQDVQADEPFRSMPVAFGERLQVDVRLKYPESLAAAAKGEERRILTLVALAAVISAGGLLLIHRTLKRERKLNEMKSQFVASVSHELRAPVASIRLMADALEEGKLPPETVKEFHRLIAREGTRLSTLVGNVLDHARIEQGRRVWKKEPSDLAPLVADTVAVMEPLARERELALSSELQALEETVDADAIQQALVNLLDNAIKFSPPGGSVSVRLVKYDDDRIWCLSVQDEGPGIPKEEQARIFERFYRPGDELRRETQGTGIGLSLVKSIAEAHGGTVTVASTPGKGSTFTLRIPFTP